MQFNPFAGPFAAVIGSGLQPLETQISVGLLSMSIYTGPSLAGGTLLDVALVSARILS